jgi:hypothetical protein
MNTMTAEPTPEIPEPPAAEKSHRTRNIVLGVFGGLMLIGMITGSGSNTDSTSTSTSGSSSGSSSSYSNDSYTSNTNKPTGKASDCSIWKKDFNECVESRTHDQLDRYYTTAKSCDIEDSDYLNCLNDAYYDSTK